MDFDGRRATDDTESKPAVFSGSSKECRDIVEVVASILGTTFVCVSSWTIFPASSFTLEALEVAASAYRFASFVAGADDRIEKRGVTHGAVRDNVFGELMMFVGAN